MSSHPEDKSKAATSPPQPIRVFLIMESRLSREALTRILRRFPDVAVVRDGESDKPPDSGIVASRCDLLVMDTCDPEFLHGLWRPDADNPSACKVLLIGMDSDRDQFLAAVRAGVTGYLLKDASASEIVVAIRALARGEAHCPPQLCLDLFRYVAQQQPAISSGSISASRNLALRQQRLVHLVAEGLTNKEIAGHLNLSEFTVRNHIHRIMRRLKATNRREVVEAVHTLQPPSWYTSFAGAERNNPLPGVHSRGPQSQRRQAGFEPIGHSTIRSLPVIEGIPSELRQYKRESR